MFWTFHNRNQTRCRPYPLCMTDPEQFFTATGQAYRIFATVVGSYEEPGHPPNQKSPDLLSPGALVCLGSGPSK